MIYRRVLLKLSGESLGGPTGKGIDENSLNAYAKEVQAAFSNPTEKQRYVIKTMFDTRRSEIVSKERTV